MVTVEEQLGEWKAAYALLNVPLDASASAIKAGYRGLMKRWHPDLYEAGSGEQAEATRMTELINEAYAKIARAPLRYRRWRAGAVSEWFELEATGFAAAGPAGSVQEHGPGGVVDSVRDGCAVWGVSSVAGSVYVCSPFRAASL